MGVARVDPIRALRRTLRIMGGLAACCLLAAAVLGGMGWQHANRDPLLARVDLSRSPAALPEADVFEVSGVVRPDRAVRWTETVRGHETRYLFLPVVGPGWTPGEPFRVILRVALYGDTTLALYDARRQSVVRLDRPMPYTTRPATALGGPGSLLTGPLPRAVAERWARQGQPLAPDFTVLDESPGAASEAYYVPAAVSGALGFFSLVGVAVAGWRFQRLRRGMAG